jgi:hypothetical protein
LCCRGSAQILRVMKLTAFLLLAAFLHVSAGGFSQTVTLSMKDAPLEKVFREIERQTGYGFLYNKTVLAAFPKISIEVKNASVENVLDKCFSSMSLEFVISGHTIVIRTRESVSGVDTTKAEITKVSGLVYNEVNQPLSGAYVTVKETNKGTTTNAKGQFSLPRVPVNSTLIVSFIGYKSQLIKVGSKMDITVALKVADNDLDKVIVQGYGNTTQRFTTGDIGVVTAEEIEKQPVMNPLLALEGRIAGVDVVQTSGYASAPIKVEVRGRSSINPSLTSDPLYVVDGVPLTVLEISGNSSYSRL